MAKQSAHTFEPEAGISIATMGGKRFLREMLDAEVTTLN
jgi:hypothetical protein